MLVLYFIPHIADACLRPATLRFRPVHGEQPPSSEVGTPPACSLRLCLGKRLDAPEWRSYAFENDSFNSWGQVRSQYRGAEVHAWSHQPGTV
jgi:hypothetical protein